MGCIRCCEVHQLPPLTANAADRGSLARVSQQDNGHMLPIMAALAVCAILSFLVVIQSHCVRSCAVLAYSACHGPL